MCHVRGADLGIAIAAEVGFHLAADPETVRAPDVAFVSSARLPAGGIPTGYRPGPPDLAIEVVSSHADERLGLDDVVPGWSPRVGDWFV